MGTSYLAVGYECNHNCIACPLTTYDRLHKKLTFEDIKKRVYSIKKDSSINHIVLSGGEPMLHPEFFKILEFLITEQFDITVLSNATQCKDEAFVTKLKQITKGSKFNIVVAIHSSKTEIHDKMTGTRGSLLETLEGLDNLAEAGITLVIKHIFNKITLPYIMETFRYLEQHYPPQVSFQFCSMDYSGRAEKNKEKLFVTLEDLKEPVEKVLDYLDARMSHKRNVTFIETPLCMLDPYYWKYFKTPDIYLDTYIAPNTDDKEIIHQVRSECGTFFKPCSDCDVKKWCSGIWKSAYEGDSNNTMLKPIHALIQN